MRHTITIQQTLLENEMTGQVSGLDVILQQRTLEEEDIAAADDDGNDQPASDSEGASFSSLMETVRDTTQEVRNEVEGMLVANPSEWTAAQIAGLAVGATIAAVIFYTMVRCLRRCCLGNQRRSSGGVGGTFHMSHRPPRVIRKRIRGGGIQGKKAFYDAHGSDPMTSLPLGTLLHGAHKLRAAGLNGAGVKVAVIDSGIDKDHPGFHGSVKKQVWYRSGTPLMEDDHGTHVAGTIHLMAPDAELYDYRVFGRLSSKYNLDGDHAIAKAILQACQDGCHIINMSLRCSYPIVPAVKEAVEFAHNRGVHMVCAAGNDGDGQVMTNELFCFPARWGETISVAAVGKKRGMPVAKFSESNPQVDCAAIGVDVISFKPRGPKGSGDLFQSMQGTSMAAPHVSGLIAALLSNQQRLSERELRTLLSTKYAIDIGVEGTDNSTGVGFVTFLSSRTELDSLLSGRKPAGGTLSPPSDKTQDGSNDYTMMV